MEREDNTPLATYRFSILSTSEFPANVAMGDTAEAIEVDIAGDTAADAPGLATVTCLVV